MLEQFKIVKYWIRVNVELKWTSLDTQRRLSTQQPNLAVYAAELVGVCFCGCWLMSPCNLIAGLAPNHLNLHVSVKRYFICISFVSWGKTSLELVDDKVSTYDTSFQCFTISVYVMTNAQRLATRENSPRHATLSLNSPFILHLPKCSLSMNEKCLLHCALVIVQHVNQTKQSTVNEINSPIQHP